MVHLLQLIFHLRLILASFELLLRWDLKVFVSGVGLGCFCFKLFGLRVIFTIDIDIHLKFRTGWGGYANFGSWFFLISRLPKENSATFLWFITNSTLWNLAKIILIMIFLGIVKPIELINRRRIFGILLILFLFIVLID